MCVCACVCVHIKYMYTMSVDSIVLHRRVLLFVWLQNNECLC